MGKMYLSKWTRRGSRAVLAVLLLAAGVAFGQSTDGAIRFSMPNLPAIAGCDAPGGLQKITTSDEPGSGEFWCGAPPTCLTVPQGGFNGSSFSCSILQYARREPRYASNGTPGVNGVRDPQDLRCNAGLLGGGMPSAGQCPPFPPPPPVVAVDTSTSTSTSTDTSTSTSTNTSTSTSTSTGSGTSTTGGSTCQQLNTCCPDGSAFNPDGTCGTTPAGPTCPDGSPMPASGICQTTLQTCPDGSPMPANGICATPMPTCPDGSPMPASGICQSPPPQTCPDGSPMPASGLCQSPVTTCPAGMAMYQGQCASLQTYDSEQYGAGSYLVTTDGTQVPVTSADTAAWDAANQITNGGINQTYQTLQQDTTLNSGGGS